MDNAIIKAAIEYLVDAKNASKQAEKRLRCWGSIVVGKHDLDASMPSKTHEILKGLYRMARSNYVAATNLINNVFGCQYLADPLKCDAGCTVGTLCTVIPEVKAMYAQTADQGAKKHATPAPARSVTMETWTEGQMRLLKHNIKIMEHDRYLARQYYDIFVKQLKEKKDDEKITHIINFLDAMYDPDPGASNPIAAPIIERREKYQREYNENKA